MKPFQVLHLTNRIAQSGRHALFAVILSATLLLGASSLRAQAPEDSLENDAAITHEVKRSILFNLLLNTKTTTSNGVVTLSGSAESVAEKTLNTRLATEVAGVISVVNNMIVIALP